MATLKKKYFWSHPYHDLVCYHEVDGYDYSLNQIFDSEQLAVAAYSAIVEKFGPYEVDELELKIKYTVC